MFKKNSVSKSKQKKVKQERSQILNDKEIRLLVYYFLAGIVLALILLIFGVPMGKTFSKFYGFLYMFLIPGLFIFRAIYKHRIFESKLEEYGYPALISWLLHSIIITIISGVFKTKITDLNLYGSSFVLLIVAIVVFYVREK